MSERLLRPLGEAQGENLFETLADVEKRILVKTLAFKLAVAVKALVDTLLNTKAGAEATTLPTPQGGV